MPPRKLFQTPGPCYITLPNWTLKALSEVGEAGKCKLIAWVVDLPVSGIDVRCLLAVKRSLVVNLKELELVGVVNG